jgi:hypothetical protein
MKVPKEIIESAKQTVKVINDFRFLPDSKQTLHSALPIIATACFDLQILIKYLEADTDTIT